MGSGRTRQSPEPKLTHFNRVLVQRSKGTACPVFGLRWLSHCSASVFASEACKLVWVSEFRD